MTRRSGSVPSIIGAVSDHEKRLARVERGLSPRDPSLLRDQSWTPPSSGDSGSCLTAVSAARTFNPYSGGDGSRTQRWTVLEDMNLVRVQIRCEDSAPGNDVTAFVDASSSSLTNTVTLTASTDLFDEWTGSEAVVAGEYLTIEMESDGSASMTRPIVQAWFDGPGGGGLILTNNPGA